jgi:adenosine kinase
MQILVSGSLAFDRIMNFPGRFTDHILPEKIHVLNVSFPVNGVQERFGGTAGNIAYGLALLGESPVILATAGRDFAEYEKWLRKHGISLEGVRLIPEEITASAYITTDMSDNQITAFNFGAMNHPSMYQLDAQNPAEVLAIVAPGNIDDMVSYSREYKKRGIRYIFDPGQSIPALTADQLVEMTTGSFMLICNDYEIEMISKATGLTKSEILKRTATVITTLGEKGSLLSTRDRDVTIPAAVPRVVEDPTGAGDAFRAGLIKGIVSGKDFQFASRMGSITASFAVEHRGTQEHKYTWDEFLDRYRSNFGSGDVW